MMAMCSKTRAVAFGRTLVGASLLANETTRCT
ncbi:hypothetical protein FX983_00804 [Pseudomonas frederiksbergensis]|uniref:Uncharacterized protein n=1 Tax=Pseudomonas frederiksbergensis TaxID=104087 RepID=A0A6L5BWT0_9PSED|nr:hypothetical protein FX983_00804 [Pseudomonas frederiksbergensis]